MEDEQYFRNHNNWYFPKRYELAIFICVGFAIQSITRTNFMSSLIYVKWNEKYPLKNEDVFNWPIYLIKWVIVSHLFGYIISAILGGFIASRFRANRLLGIGNVVSALLHLFLPLCIHYHPSYAIVINFFKGLCEGLAYPAIFTMWSYWAPRFENTSLITVALLGDVFGLYIGPYLSLYVARWTVMWSASFYICAILWLVWSLCWLKYSYLKPVNHPNVSTQEMLLIEKCIGDAQSYPVPVKLSEIPWKVMASSLPLYAIVVASICYGWNYIVIFKVIQSYVLNCYAKQFTISLLEIVLLMEITAVIPISGAITDCLRRKLSITVIRKLSTCGGFVATGILFTVIGYTNIESKEVTFILFILVCVMQGIVISGFVVNHLDIAPQYAGILVGISSAIGALAAILPHLLFERVEFTELLYCNLQKSYPPSEIDMLQTILGQKGLLITTIVINYVAGVFYGYFASAEKQRWIFATIYEDDYKAKL